MEVLGKVKVVNPEQQVSGAFKKREIVVVTDEQYPQSIMIEFTQDKCDLLSSYKSGDSVKVSINLRGREWVNPQGETKYFNSIQGWRIEKHQAQSPSQAHENNTPTATAPAQANNQQDDNDDLPF